uniref:Uncharacterized protein n=1 Tax=Anabas testudineus TaxID=64144 RepID=A0A3Q1JBR4_ANATE
NSSLVLPASCLSISTATLSDYCIFFFALSHTCFSTSRMVSSECPSFAFLTCVTALERTRLSESLALLLNCLASLTRFSLCSRVTLPGRARTRVCSAVSLRLSVRDRLTSGKLLIWFRGNFPSWVVTIMLRVKSSLRALRTPVMSSFTSSRLMMSSTRAVLIFTLADWPFAFTGKIKKGKEQKDEGKIICKTNDI